MKKGEHDYGGRYWGLGNKWFFVWFSDYRKNSVVKGNFQLEVGSKLWGNMTFMI